MSPKQQGWPTVESLTADRHGYPTVY